MNVPAGRSVTGGAGTAPGLRRTVGFVVIADPAAEPDACLAAIARQGGDVEVVVVRDSPKRTEGVITVIADTADPAAAVVAALAATDAEAVALVAQDCVISDGWLETVTDCMDTSGADVVGGPDAGTVTVTGVAVRLGSERSVDARRALFVDTGAVLVRRRVLEQAGAPDGSLGSLAAADWGWRVNILGLRVVACPHALSQCASGGAGEPSAALQAALVARNLDEHLLARTLAAAALDGALGDRPAAQVLERAEERAELQAQRRCADTALPGLSVVAAASAPGTVVGLGDVRRRARVTVLAYDPIGDKMTGPAIRSLEFAKALGRVADVTLASQFPIERDLPGVAKAHFEESIDGLAGVVADADIVLMHGHILHRLPVWRHLRGLLVVDLYNPFTFENLEIFSRLDQGPAHQRLHDDRNVQLDLLARGDFFVCASERQRDYWLGLLSATGRVDLTSGERTDDLIDIVPFGCPDEPVPAHGPALKGRYEGIGPDDLVVVWAGGVWDWFDPFTALRAFARVRAEEPRAKLFFAGLQAYVERAENSMVAELRRAVSELGLDDAVVYGDWVPYDERGAILDEADVGIVASPEIAEVRLSFRTRLLDHFWAGLPTVCTAGDVLASLVDEAGAGIAVTPGDDAAMAAALLTFLGDPQARAEAGRRAAELADRFRWERVTAPLCRLAAEPWRWPALRDRGFRTLTPPGRFEETLAERDAEIATLTEALTTASADLAAARSKLDVLARTPVYDVYKAMQRMRRRNDDGT